MSLRNVLSALVISALAAVGCGGEPGPESTESDLSAVVGTHRAIGTYRCPAQPYVFTTSTMLYVAQSAVSAHSWKLNLAMDPNPASGGLTLDLHASSTTEAADNGAVIYNVPLTPVFIHHVVPFRAIDYLHEMDATPTNIQIYPSDAAHPYGQLVMTLGPQGGADPANGDCANAVTTYLTIQP
jgi:hypothetical protein